MERPLDPVNICLYRVLQEALTNVVRHAHAKQVEVSLNLDHGYLTLRIGDDGQGFNPSAVGDNHKGVGLIGMHERVNLLGGRLEIHSAPQRGTALMARIPWKDPT